MPERFSHMPVGNILASLGSAGVTAFLSNFSTLVTIAAGLASLGYTLHCWRKSCNEKPTTKKISQPENEK